MLSSNSQRSKISVFNNNNTGGGDDMHQIKKLRRYLKNRKKLLCAISKNSGCDKKYLEFLKSFQDIIDDEVHRAISFKEKRWSSTLSANDSNHNESAEVSTTCSDSDTSPTETNIEPDSSLEQTEFNHCFNTSSKLSINDSKNCDNSTKRNEWDFSKLLIHQLQFEFYHFFPSILGVVFYCVAHISIYELINNVMLHSLKYKDDTNDHRFEYMCMILLGLALPRFTGGAWKWLNDDLYNGTRFEMHNRLRLGLLDAKIQLWFKKHKSFRDFVDLISVYFVYIGVVYYVCSWLFPFLCDIKGSLLQNLPSKGYGINTNATEVLKGALEDDWEKWECDPGVHVTHEDGCNMNVADFRYLYNTMSANSYDLLFGSMDVTAATITKTVIFYLSLALISIKIVFKLNIELD